MEELGPELKAELCPRLKGKSQERQRQWIQVDGSPRGWGVSSLYSAFGCGADTAAVTRSRTPYIAWCMSRPRINLRLCYPNCSWPGQPWRRSSAPTWTRLSPPRSIWPARFEVGSLGHACHAWTQRCLDQALQGPDELSFYLMTHDLLVDCLDLEGGFFFFFFIVLAFEPRALQLLSRWSTT
jgi:hypothetical protein